MWRQVMKLRTLKFVAAVMAVLLFALCAVSCSEDDDESLNNSATASNGDVTGCLLDIIFRNGLRKS